MAVRNGARWLGAQLDSIAAQRGCDWALHVSDDGSDDASRAIVADFAARHRDRDIRLHRWPGPGGPRHGEQHGGQHGERPGARPEWRAAAHFLALITRPDLPLGPRTHVALADQDDIWLPDKLSLALERLGAGGAGGAGKDGKGGKDGPMIHGARSLHVDPRGRITGHSRIASGPVTLPRLLVQNPIPGHTLVLNPAALRLARAAGPVPVAFHDWWLGLLVLACGGRAVLDDRVVLHYRQHRGNLLGAPGGIAAGTRRAGLVLRGCWGRWIAANLAALAALPPLPADMAPTPEAAALLAALASAPARGPGRAAAFARAGLRRDRPAEDMVLQLALCTGLV